MKPRSRRVFLALPVVVVAPVAAFLLWPAPFDAEPWQPPPARPPSGELAPNDHMRQARPIELEQGHGAEGLAVAADGSLYGGTQEGDIVRFAPDGAQRVIANTGGRPLGVDLDAEGRLVIADAYKGLLRMSLPGGELEVLTTGAEGVPFRFTDDLAIASDGVIYFSDASDTWPQSAFVMDLLETKPHGRLLKYDPRDTTTTVLARDLYFANGVALADDESFLLVNETWRYRVRRYWLKGERRGTLEPFLEALPGFPDNVTTSPRGTFWVALYTTRKPILDRLHPYPIAKEALAKLPAALRPKPVRHGFAFEVDADGNILRSVQDPSGDDFYIVTSALEHDDKLYLGSLKMKRVGVLDLAQVPGG